MLKSLQFVKGAVARKDFLPVLTHFHIENNMIYGYNGMLALCAPFPIALRANPKADQLIKALQMCNKSLKLHVTPTGKISIQSGKFRALVACTPDEIPFLQPVGTYMPLSSPILPGLRIVYPFISEDASRPWSRGVLLRGKSAFATNNVVLIEHELGAQPFPAEVNLPQGAVTELLRINEEPEAIQLTEDSCTFHYSGGRWLLTTLIRNDWPDVYKILDVPNEQKEIPKELWYALDNIGPFLEGLKIVHFTDYGLATSRNTDESGAAVDIDHKGTLHGSFHWHHLNILRKVALTCDFSLFPRPCIFMGSAIRGAIVGVKL